MSASNMDTAEASGPDVVKRALDQLPELLRQAPTPLLLLLGPRLEVALANDAYVSLLRKPSADVLLGRPFREAVPEFAGQGVFERLEGVLRTGVAHVGRQEPRAFYATGLNGAPATAYFDVIYQPIFDDTRTCIGVLAQGTDVTEYVAARVRAEERERAITAQWKQLAEMYRTAPVGFAMYEPKEFRMIHVNEKFTQMLDMPAERLLGRSVLEFAGEIPGVRERFERVAAGGRVDNVLVEGELHSQPGVYRCWLVNYTPLFDEHGELRVISTVSLDITAQKAAEAALLKSEKLAAVGRLASSIAHEINNPLESVTNLLYLAKQLATDGAQREYLEAAELELRRVAVIANQTLRFHKQLSAPVAVRGESLFQSVLTVFEGRLRNSGIQMERRFRADVELACLDGEIRQVLSNLVSNAIDAMPKGGQLILRSRAATQWSTGRKGLRMTVADTGSGIDEASRAKIFDAFYSTKGIGGTGLGLWISQEIVARHGGRLSMRSRCGPGVSGTVFTLFLPFVAG